MSTKDLTRAIELVQREVRDYSLQYGPKASRTLEAHDRLTTLLALYFQQTKGVA